MNLVRARTYTSNTRYGTLPGTPDPDKEGGGSRFAEPPEQCPWREAVNPRISRRCILTKGHEKLGLTHVYATWP